MDKKCGQIDFEQQCPECNPLGAPKESSAKHGVRSGEARTPTWLPLEHGMNCPGLMPLCEEECTCGLKWRIQLQTEREMHNAWRKRAEEAEAASQRAFAEGVGRTAESAEIAMDCGH